MGTRVAGGRGEASYGHPSTARRHIGPGVRARATLTPHDYARVAARER
jgi:hypothetical protein